MSDLILDGAARTWWTGHHLRAALTVTMGSIDEGQVGFVNGYVQLPEGHPNLGGDHGDLDLAVHRGLTCGVDERGWVGCGTGHVDDYWPDTDIDALIAATPQPRRRSLMRQWRHCRGSRPRAAPTHPGPWRGTATGPSGC